MADEGAPHTIVLGGALGLSSARLLRDELRRLAAEGGREVRVDMSELPYLDGSGLAVLLDGLKRLRHRGGDLVLQSPRASVRQLLVSAGMTDVFRVLA